MKCGLSQRWKFQRLLTAFLATALFLLQGAGGVSMSFAQVEQADENRFSSSLDFVPESASFYWSLMNNKTKINAILKSRAFTELAETRAAKALLNTFTEGFEEGFWKELDDESSQELSDWLKTDNASDLLELCRQIASNEVFVYGDEHWSSMISGLYKAYGRAFQAGFAEGLAGDDVDEEQIARMVMEAFQNELSDVEIPTVVFGGAVDDHDLALASVNRLHELIEKEVLEKSDPDTEFFRQSYRRIENDKGLLLVLEISGNEIPWEEIEQENEADAEIIDGLAEWFGDKTLVVSLGVVDRFIVFGTAPTTKVFEELGSEKRLIDSEKLKPLHQFRDKELSSIAYASSEFISSLSDTENLGMYFENMFKGIRKASNDFDGNEALADLLETDVAEFGAELQQFIPKVGAYLDFSFITSEGIEGYSYNWSENLVFDDSKPLTILNHVGGNPAFVFAARSKQNMSEYDFMVKWGKRCFEHIEAFGPDAIEDVEERERFESVLAQIRPILVALENTTRNKLIPALADGQSALILDFKTAKDSWHAMMPPAETEIPFPALAVVVSLSDSGLFKDAMRDYFSFAQQFADMLKDFPETEIPEDYEIPRPDSNPLGDGTQYSYPVLADAGFDGDIVLNLSLNDEIAVFSFLPQQSKRLMAKTPLELEGPLADSERNLMFALHYDNVATVEAFEKWGMYIVELWFGLPRNEDFFLFQFKQLQDEEDEAPVDEVLRDDELSDLGPGDFIELANKSLNLFKCFRSYTAAGYMEDGAQVTHYLFRFKDISD